jgi:N6-adenosine-specific RNA methylase IME4
LAGERIRTLVCQHGALPSGYARPQAHQCWRREHSRKPDYVHECIERLVAGPYLELFARQRRPGWDVWGNEIEKFGGPSGTTAIAPDAPLFDR